MYAHRVCTLMIRDRYREYCTPETLVLTSSLPPISVSISISLTSVSNVVNIVTGLNVYCTRVNNHFVANLRNIILKFDLLFSIKF